MERRELLYAMGSVAIAAGARPGLGQPMQDMAGMPGMNHEGGSKHQALIDSASKCSSTAEICTSHCLAMLAAGDKTLLTCAAKSRELAVVCNGLFSLASQDAPELAKYAKLTAEICTICEAECKKFPQHKPCKDCADACVACATECKKVA
jgi:Cys-rich four helix bundle protein (predicted Tat secretion target)